MIGVNFTTSVMHLIDDERNGEERRSALCGTMFDAEAVFEDSDGAKFFLKTCKLCASIAALTGREVPPTQMHEVVETEEGITISISRTSKATALTEEEKETFRVLARLLLDQVRR